MRENDVLTWLLTDQVNSTTVTASEDGTLASEIKYTDFGVATGGGDEVAQRCIGDRQPLCRSARTLVKPFLADTLP